MLRGVVDHVRHQPVAYAALFIALGGTSYAAARLPADSVGARQIRTGAVGTGEVRDRSLRPKDFKPGELPAGPRGPIGAQGLTGPQGPAGRQGPQGPAGAAAEISRVSATESSASDSDSFKSVLARCPAGSKAVSASARVLNNTSSSQQENVALTAVEVETFVNGASAVAQEVGAGTTTNWSIFVIAHCFNGIT